MIVRIWNSTIRTTDRAVYRDYIAETGLRDYEATPCNQGCQMLMQDLGKGVTEVMTMSWWDTLESIKKFAGDDYLRARYYPEDDRFLIAKPEFVAHFDVVAGSEPPVPVGRAKVSRE